MARRAARARFGGGGAFFAQGKYDEALAAFRAAVEKDPEMSEAWYGKHGRAWAAIEAERAGAEL